MPPLGGVPAWQEISLSAAQVNGTAGAILGAYERFVRAGDMVTATRCAIIYKSFNDRLNYIARETARVADVEIKDEIDATQVRPDTARGVPPMRDNIRSASVPGTPSLAYVGIALLPELDRTINPRSNDKTPYWRAQEYGHQYEHEVRGFFFGPGYSGRPSFPNPQQSRQHPLFVPSKKGRRFDPPTLEPRGFLRTGADRAFRYWQAEIAKLDVQIARELHNLAKSRGA